MRSTSDNILDMEITTEGAPELVVRGHSGDITIGATSSSSIRVHSDKFEGGHHGPDVEPLVASQDGNRVTIDTHRNHGMLRADLKIEVPIGSAVTVNTIDGDIAIHGTRGPVELSTVGGDIRVNHIRGAAKITTVSGDMHGEHLDGTLALQTTNGDVTIRHSALSRFNIHSVNGDFIIETPLARGEHYFAKTTNGDIQLWVPPDTGATVQMRSRNGEFQTDLPAEVINPSRRHWQGRINGGGANVELETLNGDVRIKKSHGDDGFASGQSQPHDVSDMPDLPGIPNIPEVPDLPDPPHPTGEVKLEPESFGASESDSTPRRPNYAGADSIEVLARLERGEISVEEAMDELDALR
jgi:hypothetical protein